MMDVSSINGQDLTARVPLAAAPAMPPGSRIAEAPNDAARAAQEGSGPGEASVQRIQEETRAEPPQARASGVRMRVDEASRRMVAQIVDDNNEVIKQIPPEEMLKIMAKVRELEGVLFDREV